jgi:hypothetical protein
LQVASVDGVTDAYQLRPVDVAIVGRGTAAPQKRTYTSAQSEEAWSPWSPFGGQPSSRGQKQQRRQKSKTFFDLLFGN